MGVACVLFDAVSIEIARGGHGQSWTGCTVWMDVWARGRVDVTDSVTEAATGG